MTNSEVAGSACSSCGCSNRPHDRFCKRCGSALRRPAPSPSAENRYSTDSEEEVCPGCGTRIGEDAAICEACGLTLSIPSEPEDDLAGLRAVAKEDAREMDQPDADSFAAPPFPAIEGTCPGCGERISDEAESCLSCGLVLNAEADNDALLMEPSGQPEVEPSVCPKCGVPADVYTGVCPECGRSLASRFGSE